jgi:hypothetical protein
VGEGGRRVDAIVLGSGWEVGLLPPPSEASEKPWTTHQFHFHLLTSLLPYLLRAPAERNIRIISLIPPTWAAALPALQGKPTRDSPVEFTARKGVTTLLLMKHFQLILDTLASAAYSQAKPIPDPNPPEGSGKKRDERMNSNIMALSVVMPWARTEVVRGAMGADESTLMRIL